MSSEQGQGTSAGSRRRRGNGGRSGPSAGGKRRPRGPRKTPNPAPTTSAPEESKEASKKRAPREREREVVADPPAEAFGTTRTGTVYLTIRRGRFNFGFISFGRTAEAVQDSSVPRLYFNPSYQADNSVFLRKGYEVTFTVEKDEAGRPVAKNIALTAAGEQARKEKDAEIAERRAAREASGEAAPRAPRARRNPAGPVVSLVVSVQGAPTTATIDFQQGSSIGRLKGLATAALGVDSNYSVYVNGAFLTKEVLAGLKDGDKVTLGEKVETSA